MGKPALALLAILSLPAAACDVGQVPEEAEDLEDNEVQSYEWSHDPSSIDLRTSPAKQKSK